MKLGELIYRLQVLEGEVGSDNGPDLEVELVTGHRTDEYEMTMDETATVELAVSEEGQKFVRIRACGERSWY